MTRDYSLTPSEEKTIARWCAKHYFDRSMVHVIRENHGDLDAPYWKFCVYVAHQRARARRKSLRGALALCEKRFKLPTFHPIPLTHSLAALLSWANQGDKANERHAR